MAASPTMRRCAWNGWRPSVTPENAAEKLAGCGGVLVPGGFGERGLEGKIAAVQYAREHGVPFWASVWACRWPWWNTPATCSA